MQLYLSNAKIHYLWKSTQSNKVLNEDVRLISRKLVQYQYVTIEGNIGAGKTTLSTKLAEHFNAKLVLEEFADNPFLPKFYEKPEQFAFQLELSFLAERYKQLKDLLNTKDMFQTLTITDYLFIKCKLFAQVNLADDEYRLFETVFDIIYPNLPAPELLIYLHCPVPRLQNNIKKRARSYEQSIPDDYLAKIQDAYWQFLRTAQIPIVVIDTSDLDFVGNEGDFQRVLDVLAKRWPVGVNVINGAL
jgi:deoxyguanosine kinase